MLVWCFSLLNRVKTAEGKVVRRVLEATEVEPKDGKLVLRCVFTWDARTDSFSPTSADEVAKRSYRLEAVRRLTGWNKDELAEEINRRAQYLEKAVEEGRLSYPEFSDAIRKFYVTGRKEEKNEFKNPV